MRTFLSIVLAIGLLMFVGTGLAQSGNTSGDSSSLISAGGPADDPAFSGFEPVTQGIRPPKATLTPDPKYPDLPEDAEPRGTVVMLIGVNVKGRVEAVRVLRSDEPAFEKPAVATVKKWKFKPAEQDGHPVPVQITVEMKFQK